MKILAIRGRNLASLEKEFEIDFTTEPLRSAGIFAITGNTGAGKSTLLDALCLALFDDTPRTNRAKENIAIPDVKDRSINQKDCRTILRRGTGEGYAEVDFMSLGGEKFRSRWMVKRARSKADGSMQNSEIRLTNLSIGQEQQGRKTELLTKITELIGLTFDQFTRSVLLAQGDFATFLKAKQSEKAELLEKLTGTEVYSRISVNIYEKTKQADQEFIALTTRIKDIELLSPETLLERQAQKQELIGKTSILKEEILKTTQKIKWLDEEEELQTLIHKTEQQRLILQNEVTRAFPRYQYLARIEKVQEIRDIYQEWKRTGQHLSVQHSNREQQLVKIEENQKKLKEVQDSLETEKKNWQEFEEKLRELEPQFLRARELDIKINGLQVNLAEYQREYLLVKQSSKRLEQSILEQRRQQITLSQTLQNLKNWFEKNQVYESLVSRVELLTNLLDDICTSERQFQENNGILTECGKLLQQDREELFRAQQEAERLQQLQPAEIMTWRSRLQEGTPCPVCGSLHHPFSTISETQTLQEAELEKAKKEIREQATRLQSQIERRQTESARLNALLENYRKHTELSKEKARTYLALLSDWQEQLNKGILQAHLRKVATQWQEYTRKQTQQNERLGQLQVTVQLEETKLQELQESLKTKDTKNLELQKELEKLQQERNLLLKGKPVEAAEKACNARKGILEEQLKICTEKQHEWRTQQETLRATLAQTEQEISQSEKRSVFLQKQLQIWLSSQEEPFTPEDLAELFSRDMTWLQHERQFLGELKEREQTLKITLTERTNRLIRHQQSKDRPSPEENRELLQTVLAEKNNLQEQTAIRLTEIELSLASHQQNENKRKFLDKTLQEKRANAENWKKLNELFGSASGSKFKEIAQGYTLEVLLVYANKHLQNLSERYKLQRIPDTLALQVVDLDMLGETRAVHSLSGGESFLISLALALGLASLSSNRMRVESLFIDEGFGSLDADTLRIAMDALERLQNQGRKIGVISHVPEMTERISTRIHIVKSSNGKSDIQIIGN